MDNIEREIPENLLNNLFENAFDDLSESDRTDILDFMDGKEYDGCHNAVKFIQRAKQEPTPSDRLRQRVLMTYRDNKSTRWTISTSSFFKVAAVLMIVLSSALIINHYLGAGSSLTPNVSGSDSGHSRHLDSLKSKRRDSIQSNRRDSILAMNDHWKNELVIWEKYILKSLFCMPGDLRSMVLHRDLKEETRSI